MIQKRPKCEEHIPSVQPLGTLWIDFIASLAHIDSEYSQNITSTPKNEQKFGLDKTVFFLSILVVNHLMLIMKLYKSIWKSSYCRR